LEHNDYTGIEFQPNLRLLWTPSPIQSFWAAISRATHTPARYDADSDAKIIFPGMEINTLGNKNLVSETVLAYELGWRRQLRENLSLDTTIFYNRYKNLITTNLSESFTPEGTMISSNQQVNGARGNTFGAELALDWSKEEWLRLQLAYSYLKMQLHATDPLSQTYETVGDENPSHQLSLRTYLRFSEKLNLNTWLRYVDDLPSTYFEISEFIFES
jgi:iron complex outermembrane receptor protein